MRARTFAVGVGTSITTFLVVGVATIELLGAGEAPGTGIIGVFAGFAAGVLAGVLATVYADRLSGVARAALVAYATFGGAFIAIAGMRYVNVPGADDTFTFPVQVGASLVAAFVVALLTRGTGLEERRANV